MVMRMDGAISLKSKVLEINFLPCRDG